MKTKPYRLESNCNRIYQKNKFEIMEYNEV
jgi:hypothetical protein